MFSVRSLRYQTDHIQRDHGDGPGQVTQKVGQEGHPLGQRAARLVLLAIVIIVAYLAFRARSGG